MATELESLLVRIDATTEGLRRELKKADVAVVKTQKKIRRATDSINKSFKNMQRSVGKLAITLASAFTARAFIRAASGMQQLEARLNAVTGNSKAAEEALSFLSATAKDQSVELNTLADGFNRLLPAVKSGRVSFDEMQKILVLANDNIKAFGLGTSEAKGLFLGLSQVLGSGTVQMEDLRQVTDRLPGSLDAIASAVGKDVGEFKNLIATGKFTVEQLKGPLLEAFELNAGAAKDLADTFESTTVRMKNAFTELSQVLGETGVIDGLTSVIERTTFTVASLAATISFFRVQWAEWLGTSKEIVEATKAYNKALDNLLPKQEQTFKALKKLEGINKKNIEVVKELTKEQKKAAKEAIKTAERQAEAMLQPWNNAFENVQDSLAEMLERGKFDFQSLADIAKKLAAEVAAAWVIRPALQSVIGSGGQAGFFNATTSGGGGGGAGGISAGDAAGTALKLGGGSALANLSGFSFGLGGFGGIPFGGFAGATGVAAGGGAAASAAAFAAIATPIALIAIPLILASLFGGGTPNPAATFGGTIGAGGAIQDRDIRAKNLDKQVAVDLADAVEGALQALVAAGINLGGQAITGGVEQTITEGGFFGFGRSVKDPEFGGVRFDPADEQAAADALNEFLVLLSKMTDVSDDVATALDNMETAGRSLEEVISDIAFATGFETFGLFERQLTDLEIVARVLTDTFAAAAETAERLGLSVEKVQGVEANRMSALQAAVGQGIAQQILGGALPGELARIKEQERFRIQKRELIAIGALEDQIQQAELLHALNMQAILTGNAELAEGAALTERERLRTASDLSRRFERVSETFKDILFELTLGKFSPLTPIANLDAIRTQVQALGAAAAGGDIQAAEDLAQLLPAFVELSGQVNGFNIKFEADRQIAEDLAKMTIQVADIQVEIQTKILETNQTGFNRIEAAIKELGLSLTVNDIIQQADRSFGLLPEMNKLLAAAFPQFSEDFGGGRFNAFLAGNPQLSDEANAIRAQFGIGPSVQGFAHGGLVSGPGGIDNIPARLSDGEFVMRASSVRAVGASTLAAMNSTGGIRTNQTGLEARMDAMIKSIGTLVRVTAEAGNINSLQLERIQGELTGLTNDARLVGAR